MTDDWKAVWERKGTLATTDLKLLDGFEDTSIDPAQAAQAIIRQMQISADDAVLEVGCGAGMIAQYLGFVRQYVGVDYSQSLVAKHIEILKNTVLCGNADHLIFRDKSFDKVFCYSVFQYFPDHAYAERALAEMKRVARHGVFVGDIAMRSHRDSHLLYPREFFDGWEITPSFYNPDRYNAYLRLEGDEKA